ncbi:MAG: cellulose synthase operon protein YhjQ/BcsQ [Acidobacteriota bacterium]
MPGWGDDHNGDVLLPWKLGRSNGAEASFLASIAAVDEEAAEPLSARDEPAMKQDESSRSPRNPETSEQADDVATLYSWANLHGAKYRDFSASRQEMRAQMRQRTLADRARTSREEAQTPPPALHEGPRWEDLLPDSEREAAAGAAAPPRREFERRFEPMKEAERGPMPPPAPEPATRFGLGAAPLLREGAGPSLVERISERDSAEVRPAWLAEPGTPPQPAQVLPMPAPVVAPPAAVVASPAHVPQPAVLPPMPAPVPGIDSLQQSRERVASRWFALRGVFGRGSEELQPMRSEGQVPVLSFFSLAGGVGKTSLVAAVGRALAARGERVLLTDTCSFGVLPFYFGAREIKPGVVRTFSGGTTDPPIRVLTLQAERYDADPDLLRREMSRGAQDVSRVVIDVATGSAPMLRQAARLSPAMIVPVVPDMASVVTLPVLENFFRNQEGLSGKPLQAWYVLNQFDPSSPLQLDVREVLRQQLGERLLPFAVHRSPAMSEALAEGMTVIDYAPSSPAAEDIMSLVTWIRNTSVAVGSGQRGVRWSER